MHTDLQTKFKMLLITQQFFSSLNVGDSKVLNELTNEFARLEKWFSDAKISSIDRQGMEEILDRIRFRLDNFDKYLPVANLRRHFEQINNPNKEILRNLLKFYLSKKNKTVTDRDKVDLIVTRWGRNPIIDGEMLLTKSPDLLDKLVLIYKDLDLPLDIIEGEMAAITALQNERMALLNIKSLRELIDRQVLLRVRKIKDEMEAIFFQPAVLTELVEVNISLHNIFQKLLAAEQPRISPITETKGQGFKQQTEVFTNSPVVGGMETTDLEQGLLSALEEIGQSLSTLALQVQTLAEKLRNQKSKGEDQVNI